MTLTKHVFIQDTESLGYMALGDASVRIIAIHHLISKYDLDALVIPPRDPKLHVLWKRAFGERVVEPGGIPASHRDARITKVTTKDWQYGNAAWNVFEAVMWENAFFETQSLSIQPPVIFPCDTKSKAAMIYPSEKTDGNRVLDGDFWIEICQELRANGWRIHHIGDKGQSALSNFYKHTIFDQEFPPTIDGLAACISSSALALGGNTGPSWTCLMSPIPQIVVETKCSPHGYWNFDRTMPLISKQVTVLNHTISCLGKSLCRF